MKLKATLLVALAVSAVGVSQAQAATTEGPVAKAAAWACMSEKAQLGRALFRATYGATPMRTCMRQTQDEAVEAVRNAAQECRVERAEDPDAFREKYGDRNGDNAFGRCVSRHARGELVPEVRATVNAARSCQAERRADADAFQEKYANDAGRRAFARCVVATKAA